MDALKAWIAVALFTAVIALNAAVIGGATANIILHPSATHFALLEAGGYPLLEAGGRALCESC